MWSVLFFWKEGAKNKHKTSSVTNPFAPSSPHTFAHQPPGLYKRLSDSFGYLTARGYCAGGKCSKWPVLLGDFSAPHAGAPEVR